MKQIRIGCFETNSSSVHAMVICSEEDYKKLSNGEVLLEMYGEKVVTWEEAMKQVKTSIEKYGAYTLEDGRLLTSETEIDVMISLFKLNPHDLREFEFSTLEAYGEDYEFYDRHFTTPGGEKMVAFGYTGYDG